jgi:hypothetical protein
MADPYSPYQNQPTQPGGYYPPPGQGGQPAYAPGPYGPAQGGYGPGGYGPGGPGGPGGPYGPGMPPPRKSGSTGVIIGLIAGVLVLIVGVVIAIVLVFPDESTTTPGGGPTSAGGGTRQEGNAPQAAGEYKPTEFYESGPSSHYAKLATRSSDATPATLDEVFAEAKRLPSYGPFQGIQVTLKDSRLDTDCAAAAWGSGLQQTLRSADCNQMIRGVYVDDANRFMGQIFILNLRDEQGALSVVRGIDPDIGNSGFFKPLTSAPAQSFGQGNSEARAEISGHWVVMSWVQYTDGAQEKSFGDFIPMGVIIRNAGEFIIKRNIDAGG